MTKHPRTMQQAFGPYTSHDLEPLLESNERVIFEVPDTWFQIVNVRGWKFLLVHGDDVRAWMQIPFYGAERYSGRWRELLASLNAGFKNIPDTELPDFDYILLGHHHNHAYWGNIRH